MAIVNLCACGCLRPVHGHYRPGTDCGRCGRQSCPRFRPVRERWYQFWRSWPDVVWFTVFDLELLSQRPEEIR